MRRLHYGWVLVIFSLVITALAAGVAMNCFSLFIVPVCTDLGYTRAQMGFCQTINALGFMLASFFSGWLYRKISVKRVMQVSAVLLAFFYFLYSKATALWMFYGCAVICSLSSAMLTWVPLAVILNNWFHKNRALAIGIAFMGSGIGGMVGSSVGGRLVQALGWRATFSCFALVFALVLIPVTLWVICEHPKDKGMKPFGYEGQTNSAQEQADGMLLRDAVRTRRFYGICLLLIVFGFGTNGFTATFVPHLEDSGYTPVDAAMWYSGQMLLLAVGKLCLGGLIDKIGTRKAALLSLTLLFIALSGLILCRIPVLLIVMLLASSVGNCFPTVGVPLLARSVYGQKDFAAFSGMMNAVANIGSTASPFLLGLVRDFTGSYSPGYMAILGMVVLSFALVFLCVPAQNYKKRTKRA